MNQKDNHKSVRTFCCGAATALIFCVGITGAMAAASGNVSFNVTEVTLDSEKVFPKNKDLRMEDGTTIPSTILYTDENGNGTTYIPIRVLTEALHMDTSWMAGINRLNVSLSGDQALYMMDTDDAGGEWTGIAEEVEPVVPAEGTSLLREVCTETSDALQREFSDVKLTNGEYISFTVTNHGHFPLQFDLGFNNSGIMVSTPTQIPAGTTVTRTVKILSEESLKKQPLTIKVGNAEGASHDIEANVSAMQFKNL